MTTFWENRRHARIRELLSSYIDGEVSASEARRVGRHLADCAECAADIEALRATTALLSRLPLLEAPRSYALTPADVEEATAQPRRLPSFTAFTGGLAAAGAAAFVVALLVGVVFLVRLGFTGSTGTEAPQAAAPAPRMAAAPPAPAQAPMAAAPAAAPTSAPAAAPTHQKSIPAPAPAGPAISAPRLADVQTMEDEEATKEVESGGADLTEADTSIAAAKAMEITLVEATATAKAYIAAQATYETQVATSQAAAAAAAQEQAKYATSLAQWEQDQAERAQEQAAEQHATQATFTAQLADTYATSTAQAQERAARATAVETQATRDLMQDEGTVPIWALVVVGVAALVAGAAIAAYLAQRRADG